MNESRDLYIEYPSCDEYSMKEEFIMWSTEAVKALESGESIDAPETSVSEADIVPNENNRDGNLINDAMNGNVENACIEAASHDHYNDNNEEEEDGNSDEDVDDDVFDEDEVYEDDVYEDEDDEDEGFGELINGEESREDNIKEVLYGIDAELQDVLNDVVAEFAAMFEENLEADFNNCYETDDEGDSSKKEKESSFEAKKDYNGEDQDIYLETEDEEDDDDDDGAFDYDCPDADGIFDDAIFDDFTSHRHDCQCPMCNFLWGEVRNDFIRTFHPVNLASNSMEILDEKIEMLGALQDLFEEMIQNLIDNYQEEDEDIAVQVATPHQESAKYKYFNTLGLRLPRLSEPSSRSC